MGVLVGLANALSVGLLNVFLKKLTGLNPNFLTWVRVASAAPILAILVSVFSTWAVPPLPYWLIVVFITLPLEIILAASGTKAVQLSPLSVISPIAATTSIFLIPVGYLLLDEVPTWLGAGGVLSAVVGSFFLGWRYGENKFHEGLRDLFREPGSHLALFSAFVASVVIAIAKFTFRYAPPLLSAFYITTLMAVALAPLLFFQSRSILRLRTKDLSALAALSGMGIALHYVGLSLISAAYYVSIKRLSVVFSVFWGRMFFQEAHTIERLVGALLMVAGVALIALG